MENGLNDFIIEPSNPDCSFCASKFGEFDLAQETKVKKKLAKKGEFNNINEDEVFFKMCLLQYVMKYPTNVKLREMKHKQLYDLAINEEKL